MAKTYVTLTNEIEQTLQDSTNLTFTLATELNDRFQDGLRKVAEFVPHIVKVPFAIETRAGAASSTTSGALVDATETQFLAGDVGKNIHNTSDNTWAVVTAFVSTSQLTLSRDIMVSGENYRMYNKDCSSQKQINIEDVEDYIWIDKIEFPVGKEVLFSRDRNIVTLKLDTVLDDTKDANANKIIHVFFNKRHKVSQLTDFAGAVDLVAGYSEGDTSIVIDGLEAGTPTIEEDQEFTIAGRTEVYTITAAATIGTNEATVSFFPGLEADLINDVVVTLIASTLDRNLERALVKYVAGSAALSKAMSPIVEITNAITALALVNSSIDSMSARITQVITDIASGRTEVDKVAALITLGAVAVGELGLEIDQSIIDLDTGRSEINKVGVGGANIAGQYANHAMGGLSNARAKLTEAQGHFTQGRADEALGGAYLGEGAGELNAAASILSQSGGYAREVTSRLSVVNAARAYTGWGSAKMQEAIDDLQAMAAPKYAEEPGLLV
ncbi:hypothetical protein LCGC14_0929750 [marine sediment metagenome]|uniref:Uncharacterized protein n=1 Tax=marine sediment metagenome TaxID=412755 RepID=A0A0F9NSU2_9ZZZZ